MLLDRYGFVYHFTRCQTKENNPSPISMVFWHFSKYKLRNSNVPNFVTFLMRYAVCWSRCCWTRTFLGYIIFFLRQSYLVWVVSARGQVASCCFPLLSFCTNIWSWMRLNYISEYVASTVYLNCAIKFQDILFMLVYNVYNETFSWIVARIWLLSTTIFLVSLIELMDVMLVDQSFCSTSNAW